MFSSVFALSCLGATLSVHVVEVKDVGLDRALEVAHLFGDALSFGSGDGVVVSDQLWSPCEDETTCARELALADGASAIVLLHFFQTPNYLLMIADRRRDDGARVLTASRRLGARAAWKTELTALAREVFSDRRELASPDLPASRVEDRATASGPPWLLIGGGASIVFASVATGFALSSLSARNELLDGARGPEIATLTARMETHQTVANLCIAGTVSAILASVLLEVLE